jgi:Putative adhesin
VTTVAFTPTRPRGRTAWRIAASVLALAVLLWGSLSIVNLLAHGEERFARTIDAAGITTIDVSTDRGSVRVIGTDRDDISLHSYISNGLGGTDHTERVRNGRLAIDASCAFPVAYWCTASYTLRVPRGMKVIAWSGSGRIEVSGTTGAVDLGSQHGDIEAVGLRSRQVRATTDHGSVHLRFASAPRRVTAASDHGDVQVVVPRKGDAYRVELSTDHGGTRADVRTDSGADRIIELQSGHGDVTVRYGAARPPA